MRFHEAMKALEEGKKVRCCAWDQGEFWVSSKLDGESNPWNDCAYRIRVLMSHYWEIYEEPEKTYSFAEVVQGLSEGKTYKRKSWEKVIRKSEDYGIIFSSDFEPWISKIDDFTSDDWIEVKE